ncbi:MAG: hypothetical protein COY40_01040 [Alphaproteobacteria bacterium CG_4_10_14_0_8_um_filter_53_9]|nr:MAG: hypothetical protein COY40_01040 [Alphaproteobacteria bacterium CG_4_10_14_0_8_um_filter_53_9]
MSRLLYMFSMYLLIAGLLALYLDARWQITTYRQEKEKICTDYSLAVNTLPAFYKYCTTQPDSLLQNLKQIMPEQAK